MPRITQAVILAGGRGTRLQPLTDTLPKPMVPVNGRPFLEYLVELLRDNGITDVVLLLGYLSGKIIEHFGDGKKFGVNIRYSVTPVEDETGTRLKKAAPLLSGHFLLMYCDNYWLLSLPRLAEFYERKKTLASVVVFSNWNRMTKNNVCVDGDGLVVSYDKSRTAPGLNGVEAGFFIVDKKILDYLPEGNPIFESEVLPRLAAEKLLAGFLTDQRYYSIGSPDRLVATEKFLKPRKVVLVDRDGVINKKPPTADYVKRWEEFEFLPGAVEGLKLLMEKGYEIYLVTNQPGVARGMMTREDLETIHEKMCVKLRESGAELDGIYSCPHGWDEGCFCRKPKPGLLFRAADERHFDLTKAVMIGDDERDRQAGEAAGCRVMLVTPERSFLQIATALVS